MERRTEASRSNGSPLCAGSETVDHLTLVPSSPPGIICLFVITGQVGYQQENARVVPQPHPHPYSRFRGGALKQNGSFHTRTNLDGPEILIDFTRTGETHLSLKSCLPVRAEAPCVRPSTLSVVGPKAKRKKEGTSRWCEFLKIHVGISLGVPRLSRTAEDDDTELRSHTAPFTPVWTSIAPDSLQK